MTRHLIALLAFATLLFGCTQEEQNAATPTTTVGEPVVTFLAAANDPTRGTAMSGTFDTNAQFRVYATIQEREGDEPKAGTTPESFINGDVVSYQRIPAYVQSGYIWVWKTDVDYLWPQDNYMVTFYAVHPASAPQMTGFPDIKTFVYTNGEDGQLIDGNTDLMYAYVQTHRDDKAFTSVTENVSDNSTVALRFHHLLSQVAFYGQLSNLFASFGWTVEVGGITLHNINAAATVQFATSSFTITAADTPVLQDYILAMNDSRQPVTTTTVPQDGNNKNIPLTSPTDVMMLVPQTLTAWIPAWEDPTNGTTITDNDTDNNQNNAPKGSYLEIAMRVKDRNNQYQMGTADSYQTVYVPFSTVWQSGKRHNYTLTFGAGCDAQGQPIIQTIGIEAAITPWETEEISATVKRKKPTN